MNDLFISYAHIDDLPISEEGQIFASPAFAALSAVESRKSFLCDYAGTRKLPKGAGSIPVFVLRHKPA